MIGTSTCIIGVRLAHHISSASLVTYYFIAFFERVLGREQSLKVCREFIGNFNNNNNNIACKLTFEYDQMRVTSKIPKNYKQNAIRKKTIYII